MFSVVQHTSVYTCAAAEQPLLSNKKRCDGILTYMLDRSHSVADGLLSCLCFYFLPYEPRSLSSRCMAESQLSTAGDARLLLGTVVYCCCTVVYCSAKLSTA